MNGLRKIKDFLVLRCLYLAIQYECFVTVR